MPLTWNAWSPPTQWRTYHWGVSGRPPRFAGGGAATPYPCFLLAFPPAGGRQRRRRAVQAAAAMSLMRCSLMAYVREKERSVGWTVDWAPFALMAQLKSIDQVLNRIDWSSNEKKKRWIDRFPTFPSRRTLLHRPSTPPTAPLLGAVPPPAAPLPTAAPHSPLLCEDGAVLPSAASPLATIPAAPLLHDGLRRRSGLDSRWGSRAWGGWGCSSFGAGGNNSGSSFGAGGDNGWRRHIEQPQAATQWLR